MLEKSILNELQLIKGFLALILKTLEGKDIPNHSQTLEEQNGHSLGTSSDSDNNIKPSRSERGCGNIIGKTKEGFRKFCGVHGLCPKCQDKYTKKYSKRNGIHQVGLKEDKQ